MKLLCCLAICFTARSAHAAVVVDSFDETSFSLSASGQVGTSGTISSPYGPTRRSTISSRLVPQEGSLACAVDAEAGTFNFAAHGQSIASTPLSASLNYYGAGTYSLIGQSVFEFDFSQLQGQGAIVIEIGGQSNDTPQTLKFDIDHSGIISVPFSYLNSSIGATIDSFPLLSFTFEARSEDFSFTLDEIRAVPEASTLMASALGAGALALRRRRR